MSIISLTNSDRGATVRDQIAYRSRLQRQASKLLAKQKAGGFLDNQQKRLLWRWQRIEAQRRAEAEGRAA